LCYRCFKACCRWMDTMLMALTSTTTTTLMQSCSPTFALTFYCYFVESHWWTSKYCCLHQGAKP
jgi:hypothetical protein